MTEQFLQSFEPDNRSRKGGYDPNGSVVIIGAGGIGFWLAVAFSRMGEFQDRKIIIYDDDTLIGGNGHRRLPKTKTPHMYKVDLLAQHLSIFNSFQETAKQFTFVKRKFSLFDISRLKARLVIDATDAKLDWRTLLYRDLEKRFIPFVRCSYDGTVVTFSRSVPLSISNDGGYNLIPNMGVSLAAAGICAEKIRRIIAGENVPNEDYHFGEVWYPEHPQEEMIESIIERTRPENAPVYDEHGMQIGVASDFYDFVDEEQEENEDAQEILEGEETWMEEQLAAANDEREWVESDNNVPAETLEDYLDMTELERTTLIRSRQLGNQVVEHLINSTMNNPVNTALTDYMRSVANQPLVGETIIYPRLPTVNDLPVIAENNEEIQGDFDVSNT